MKRNILVASILAGLIGGAYMVRAAMPIQYCPREECSLCGNPKSNILDAYNHGVGILNFNVFSVADLNISGETPGQRGSSTSFFHVGDGSVVYMNTNVERRFAYVKIKLNDNIGPEKESMARFLCKQCTEKICKENVYDVGFVDYETHTITPIGSQIEIYMNDYVAFEVSEKDDQIKYLVFYAPER